MSIADKLATVAENMQKVYQAGYDKGNAITYYRGSYSFIYAWSAVEFPQDFDFILHTKQITAMTQMFNNAKNIKSITIRTDEEYRTDEGHIGIVAVSGFRNISTLETVDITQLKSKFSDLSWCFMSNPMLKSIYGAIDMSYCTKATSLLTYTYLLEDIEFVPNTIGIALEFNHQKVLNKASITSIINGLSDTTSGLTVTLSKAAVNKAFETAEGFNDGENSQEWEALAATKTNNWTISLL